MPWLMKTFSVNELNMIMDRALESDSNSVRWAMFHDPFVVVNVY